MSAIPGYKLYSFATGSQHVRSFAVKDVGGILADFVLGECGAPESPLPADHYKKVKSGDGVELVSADESRRFVASLDNCLVSERSTKEGDEFTDIEGVRERAITLMGGAYSLMKSPKLIFVGMVWEFVRTSIKDRERFNHPVAEHIAERVLKVQFLPQEHPAEVTTRFVFRKKLGQSWLYKGLNDFVNVAVTIRDNPIDELWPPARKPRETVDVEPSRVTVISVDVQRLLDPRRPFDPTLLSKHWDYSQDVVSDRIVALVTELGLGEAKE